MPTSDDSDPSRSPESDATDASTAEPDSPTAERASDADAPGMDEGEWRFDLDEVGPEAEDDPEPIEPGSPTLENTLFVLVGIVGTLLLLATVL